MTAEQRYGHLVTSPQSSERLLPVSLIQIHRYIPTEPSKIVQQYTAMC